MRDSTTTIHTKAAFLLFLLASFSPSARLSGVLAAKYGNRAGWVSILLSCAVYCGLIALLSRFFRVRGECGLYGIYRSALGGIAGNAVGAVYLV